MRSTISSKPYSLARQVTSLALILLCGLQGAQASGEKRVTVPIALPFQLKSSASSAGSSVATAPIQTLQTTAFTQTVAASSASSAPGQATAPVASLSDSSPASSLAIATTIPVASLAASSVSAKPAAQPAKTQVAATAKTQASAAAKPAPKAEVAKPKPAVAEPAELARTIPIITTAPIKAPRFPAGHPEAFIAEFEDYVAKKVAPFVPGVAIVVVSGGQIKSLQGYGVRRAGTREKVTPDTVFRLASLSKPFAATAASALVNEGKITWDTTVTSVLPDVAFKNARYGKQLTLRHVLSQASGLPRHTYTHFIDENMSYADTVRRLRYVNFVCPPGKCFAYQNVSYSLAGDMIKKKSGVSFEKYVGQHVFDPLGMTTASYGLANYNASPNRASPHINNGSRWIPTSVTGNWYRVAPAAGVNASIVDMSRFLLGQMGKRQDALPLSVLNPIQSRVTKNTPAQNYYGVRKAVGNTAYGMGWRVFDYGRYKNFVHHGGHVKGFRTEMVFNRDLQIGMVFLSNSETRLARDIIFRFIDSYERAQVAARAAAKKK
ncbi:serine hydrolase domain-containing protein [Cellvibrio sp. UBA7661]|uniref:serine hydrolase domain-containing protein n=1 Tax=Cellvibrio sp. UBA7661 TaxID=1946311 RepID=UPI002F35DDB9